MARLRTISFDLRGISSAGATQLEGITVGTVTIDTATVRTGPNSLKCDSGAGNAQANARSVLRTAESVLGRTYPVRICINLPAYPGSSTNILSLFDSGGSTGFAVKLTTTGTLQLLHSIVAAETQIGSDSAPLNQNQWYVIELSALLASGATDAAELRLDTISVASGAGLNVGDSPVLNCRYGWHAAPGANKVIYIDDVAWNDDQGSDQNSWPGDRKCVALFPISDNAVGTGWVDGDGAGTLFGSVDNSPPAGAATPADGTQIKNLTSTTTGNYDADMTAYAAAGIVAGDRIVLVQAVCDHGEDVNTATKNGALQIVSNPAQSGEDSFVYGDDLGADAAWPANWANRWGTPQYNPAVTLTTSPVLRVGKRTATTREVHVDQMAIIVEFEQGIFPPWHAQARVNTDTLIRM